MRNEHVIFHIVPDLSFSHDYFEAETLKYVMKPASQRATGVYSEPSESDYYRQIRGVYRSLCSDSLSARKGLSHRRERLSTLR